MSARRAYAVAIVAFACGCGARESVPLDATTDGEAAVAIDAIDAIASDARPPDRLVVVGEDRDGFVSIPRAGATLEMRALVAGDGLRLRIRLWGYRPDVNLEIEVVDAATSEVLHAPVWLHRWIRDDGSNEGLFDLGAGVLETGPEDVLLTRCAESVRVRVDAMETGNAATVTSDLRDAVILVDAGLSCRDGG